MGRDFTLALGSGVSLSRFQIGTLWSHWSPATSCWSRDRNRGASQLCVGGQGFFPPVSEAGLLWTPQTATGHLSFAYMQKSKKVVKVIY